MNLMWSMVLLTNAFAGIPPTTATLLIVVGKIIGYGLSILIEMWFYARQREYYFKNMGVSYYRLFACLFALDAIITVFIASLWLVVRNFI